MRSFRGTARRLRSGLNSSQNHLVVSSIAPNAKNLLLGDGVQCTVFVPKEQDIAPNGLLAAIKDDDWGTCFHMALFLLEALSYPLYAPAPLFSGCPTWCRPRLPA